MAIKYPITDCNTDIDKLEFLYQAMEKLRLEHNAKGKDHHDGKLSDAGWKEYKDKTFKPKNKQLGYEIALLREMFGYSTLDIEDEKNETETERIAQEKQTFLASDRYAVDLGDLTA